MRAGSFITHMQSLLGDPNGDFHTTEKMLLHLNTAIEDICTRSRSVCSWMYIDAVAGQGQYGLPDDFLEFKFVGFYYQDKLIPLSPSGMRSAAPAVFSERYQSYNQIPFTYADGGHAHVEKLVGTVIETEDATVAEYTGVEVPEQSTFENRMNQYVWSDISDDDVWGTGRWLGEVADADARLAITTQQNSDLVFQQDTRTIWNWDEFLNEWDDGTSKAQYHLVNSLTGVENVILLNDGYTDAELDTYFESHEFSTQLSTYVYRTGDVNSFQKLTAVNELYIADYTIDYVIDNGPIVGYIESYGDPIPTNETGIVFIEANQAFQQVDGGVGHPSYISIAETDTESGTLTLHYLGSARESELRNFWTEDGPYQTDRAYYYFDTDKQELRLVQRATRYVKAYVGDPERTLAVEVTPTEYDSILVGDKIINYTDNSEGIVTDKSLFSETVGIFHFQMFNGADNMMEIGDEFRILSNTEHLHSILLSPPPQTDDEIGSESIFIYYAKRQIPISMFNITGGTDEIELGAEWHSALRHRVGYYASLEEKGVDNPQTQFYDIKYETDYMRTVAKANRRIREAISSWTSGHKRFPNRVTISQIGDYAVRNPTVS